MPNPFSRSKEELRGSSPELKQAGIDNGIDNIKLNEAASDIAGSIEDLKISEHNESGKEEKSDGLMSKQSGKKKKMTRSQLRKHLIENPPNENVMRKQIDKTVSKEMKTLKKNYSKVKNNVGFAYEANAVIAKIRELKRLLDEVAHAGMEALQKLWLQIVHKFN